MEICDSANHVKIVYDGNLCPLCMALAAVDRRDAAIKRMEAEHDRMEMEIDKLEESCKVNQSQR